MDSLTCFVTYNTAIVDDLRRLFRGHGLLFDIDGHGCTQFVRVRIPRKPVEEQAAMLKDILRHSNRLNGIG